jgi:hypothetical protein
VAVLEKEINRGNRRNVLSLQSWLFNIEGSVELMERPCVLFNTTSPAVLGEFEIGAKICFCFQISERNF